MYIKSDVCVTTIITFYLSLYPSSCVAVSPSSQCAAASIVVVFVVVVSLCRCVVVSLCRCVVVSLCRCVVVSLCRCVVVSLCRCLGYSVVILSISSTVVFVSLYSAFAVSSSSSLSSSSLHFCDPLFFILPYGIPGDIEPMMQESV